MADGTDTRPLSPHLWSWKWHATMAASIFHRATGVGNYLGAMLIAGWLFAVASGPEAYQTYAVLFESPLGQLVLFGFTVSVFFHLANGIRYLVWDAGHGFTPKLASNISILNIAIGVFGAAALWIVAGLV
ncbi:MAG: succinate dehydrogenase, cytochrome b556 subunit [Pseudomonadota bacterium]